MKLSKALEGDDGVRTCVVATTCGRVDLWNLGYWQCLVEVLTEKQTNKKSPNNQMSTYLLVRM